MNKFKTTIALILVILGTIGIYSNTLAQTSSGSALKQKLTQKEELLRSKTELEINRRLTSLANLTARVEAMKKLNADNKNSLVLQIQDQINSLNTLKVKIQADIDIQALKDDRLAVANQYRIYLLFIPKMHILAASDKVTEITSDIDKLVSKVQIRIDEANKSGKDTTIIQKELDNIKSKIADANLQAKAATDLVMPLVPDDGDKIKFTSNKQALQDARKILVIARQDLKDAKQGFGLIKQELNPVSKVSSPSATK